MRLPRPVRLAVVPLVLAAPPVAPLVTRAAVAATVATPPAPDAPVPQRTRVMELPGVQGRIDHLAVDLAQKRLYVAALGNDSVEVIDLDSGQRLQAIAGLAEPQGVAVATETHRLFVANGRDGTLRLFDGEGLAPAGSLSLGDDADNVRLDPEGRAWVGYGEGALAAVDAGGRRITEVALGAHPESFQVERKGRRIFVNVPARHEVTVVDRSRPAIVGHWPVTRAAANYPMALDEAGHRLFVVCRTPPRLLVFDTATGGVVAEQPTVGDADDVFLEAGSGRLFVSGGEGALVIHDCATGRTCAETARLPTARGARTSLLVPELRRLFLAVRRERDTPAAIWEYELPQ